MYKLLIVFVASCAVSKGRPASWQLLPPVPGYVPVYIQHGDTPLEEINLELAEAFHAIPSGRSAGKHDIAAGDNDVAGGALADAPHPPDVAEPAAPSTAPAAARAAPAGYQREATLYPPQPNESKRAHDKKYKKVASDNTVIQKIPAN